MSEAARQELLNLVNSTENMRQIFSELEQEPLRLLCTVCREKQRDNKPVPDHRLALHSYFAETALRSLVGAGLLKQIQGGSFSIYDYEPTETGLALYSKLVDEGTCKAQER